MILTSITNCFVNPLHIDQKTLKRWLFKILAIVKMSLRRMIIIEAPWWIRLRRFFKMVMFCILVFLKLLFLENKRLFWSKLRKIQK